MTEINILKSGVHPLLASILAPRVPQIHLEMAISCLQYLRSGSHSVKSRKSLKPLLKASYLTRLKMRPSLSRFRKDDTTIQVGAAQWMYKISTPHGGAITQSVLTTTLAGWVRIGCLFPSAPSATGQSMRLTLTYGSHTDAPCKFSPSCLKIRLLILTLHPFPPTACSALSAPHIHRK